MLTTHQLELSLTLPAARTLIPLEAVMVLTDRSEDAVIELMDCGALPWAWDIARAGADRRELRIWRDCLVAWLANPCETYRQQRFSMESEEAVLASLFPHGRPEQRGTELQRMFSCGHSHIINLIADGLLTSTTEIRTGPNGSPRITRLSVIQFLQSRRAL
jgi:hypothetical protein